MNKYYDYIIIGAGPSGLTLAYYLGKLNKKCLLIDKQETIGGCHRVVRHNGLFTEHSPRIYSDSYLNFIKLLENMNLNFNDLFVPYNFSIANIGGKSLSYFNFKEIIIFMIEFIKLLFDENYSKYITMKQFTNIHNFSNQSIDYIDRLCRLTDGADITRYTLFEFLQLINQMSLYKLYQPSKPNDIGLFKFWYNAIMATNNVDIILNKKVENINYSKNKIINITIDNIIYTASTFILAIPPEPLFNILKNSGIENSFMESKFEKWVEDNSYIDDLGITFHWNVDLKLKKIWGFPKSEWGVAFNIISDYMNFEDDRSKTVISIAITMINSKSLFNNKTPHECNENELLSETFRQLKLSYPELPEPTISLLNPLIKRINNKWVESDTGYVVSANKNTILPSKSIRFDNLYNVGTQNGNSKYYFTSMESAVSNSLSLLHILEPITKINYPIYNLNSIVNIIKIIIFICLIIYLIIIIYKIPII